MTFSLPSRLRGMNIARSRTTIVLVAGAISAWAITVYRMRGMDAGPGTDLGGLGWYLGIWVTMTAAMMLPSAAPAARHVARLARRAPSLLLPAGALVALGMWVAVSPASVPGLTQPGGSPSMEMGSRARGVS